MTYEEIIAAIEKIEERVRVLALDASGGALDLIDQLKAKLLASMHEPSEAHHAD